MSYAPGHRKLFGELRKFRSSPQRKELGSYAGPGSGDDELQLITSGIRRKKGEEPLPVNHHPACENFENGQ